MGIVKFSTREEMNNAISTMNGSVRNGEWIESVDVGWTPDRGARVPGRAGIHGSGVESESEGESEGERRENRSEAKIAKISALFSRGLNLNLDSVFE